MKVGIDILEKSQFQKTVTTKPNILKKLFSDNELRNSDLQHLCGLFCAKESLVKIDEITKEEFRTVEVLNNKEGKPHVYKNGRLLESIAISISHSDNICTAIAISN